MRNLVTMSRRREGNNHHAESTRSLSRSAAFYFSFFSFRRHCPTPTLWLACLSLPWPRCDLFENVSSALFFESVLESAVFFSFVLNWFFFSIRKLWYAIYLITIKIPVKFSVLVRAPDTRWFKSIPCFSSITCDLITRDYYIVVTVVFIEYYYATMHLISKMR